MESVVDNSVDGRSLTSKVKNQLRPLQNILKDSCHQMCITTLYHFLIKHSKLTPKAAEEKVKERMPNSIAELEHAKATLVAVGLPTITS
jgi:hypothetical protein